MAAALAVLVGAGVGRVVARARTAEDRWGRSRQVLVATKAIAPGDPLAGQVRLASWPAGLVGDGWPTSVPATVRAAGPIGVGAPVTAASLVARPGGGGEADEDRRRVAVPVGDAPLPLRRGDRVDVWATTDPSLAEGRTSTRRVAVAAMVDSASSRSVVVAVRPAEVAAVAEATSLATVTLVAVAS